MANVLTQRGKVISSEDDLSDEERMLLARVRADKDFAEKARKPYEKRWNEWDGLYSSYQRFAEAHRGSSEPDRDEVVNEGKREFGSELFIPYVFAIIETALPALLMNNPRMKVKPKRRALERERAEAVRGMFEERQREIDYALKLIPIGKSGLMNGLGVGKNFWDIKEREALTLESNDLRARIIRPYVKREREVNEGPKVEDVDVFNFFWDPAAKDMETCRFAIHRTWRDLGYIRERVARREWAPVDLDAVKRMAPETSRDSVMRERMAAVGMEYAEAESGEAGRLHEVWEWHNGTHMVTVLDGKLVVQAGKNPFAHGELPFSIFRPTIRQSEFVGVGEIQPIVDLQHELNALRSLRLDNTYLIVNKAFMYADGLVDPADFILGPAKGIPVDGGSIDDVLRPIVFGDLPNASYQESGEIKSDIERAVGFSEDLAGSSSSSGTATEAQIVMSGANRRVELKVKMLTHEHVVRDSRQWLEMYRQHMLLKPREIAVDTPTGYEWIEVTGQDLDLVEAVLPEDDSMAPEDIPQKRNDALALNNQLTGEQVVDPRVRLRHLLNAFDVPDAEAWILPEVTEMNPQVAQTVGEAIKDTLEQTGMDPEQAAAISLAAMQQAMGATGLSQPIAQPSGNGVSPEPQPQEA